MSTVRRDHPGRIDSGFLIAEQQGQRIVLLGILMSIFFGFGLRYFFSPERIKVELTRAAGRIDPRLDIQFESARSLFAKAGLPYLGVLVTGIRATFRESCLGEATLSVDEIYIPISVMALFQGRFEVSQIQLVRAEADLRRIKSYTCKLSTVKADVPVTAARFQELKRSLEAPVPPEVQSSSLKRVLIDTLKIHSQREVEGDSLAIEIENQVPVQIRIRGSITGDPFRHKDYFRKANLELILRESDTLTFTMSGEAREGRFQLEGHHALTTNSHRLNVKLNQVPFSYILYVLRDWSGQINNQVPRSLWASGEAEWTSASGLNVKKLTVEGAQSRLHTNEFILTSLAPPKGNVIEFTGENLDLDEILVGYLHRSRPAQIGTWGHIDGSGKLDPNTGTSEFAVQGRDMSLVFSNHGERRNQFVSSYSASVAIGAAVISGQLDSVKLEGGDFQGHIDFSTDRNFHNWSVSTPKPVQISFGSQVIDLMTGGGSLDTVKLLGEFKSVSGQLESLRVHLETPRLIVEGQQFEGLRFDTRKNQSQARFPFEVQATRVFLNLPKIHSPLDVPALEPWSEGTLENPRVSGSITEQGGLSLLLERGLLVPQNAKFRGEIKWDEVGILTGEVRVAAPDRNRLLMLSGTRSQPVVLETSPSPIVNKKRRNLPSPELAPEDQDEDQKPAENTKSLDQISGVPSALPTQENKEIQ